ncbi:pseudouridine synthase [Saitoella complicata NRRL Y-17804]|uniref:pseudouridine synthase n=1 Tax=Saitoella complicata (strain BCRC 22490 / CBS 7301 / JCM 7358 / NBRC 10748 / NRRL Y-17804) TaxID=698492 RepID=UPI000867DBB8|nr:pseudouridine synthase [Saitoella complicata NRRL Y-17804]ODQ54311.1 pseudouridine synthase [Saitoella complicata NRRL Y-17804]
MENKGDQNYISGLFAVNKPSGHLTSASITNRVKYLLSKSPNFAKEWPGGKRRSKKTSYAKLGHGGTLDPLASGIMVLGVNDGTKELSSMLNCSKDYTATVLLGSATDTYDSQGKIVTRAPWEHITPEMIDEALAKFRGPILQKPPIYSACKVDGKKLYEYARYGIPLPRPIEARPVTIFKLEWSGWKNGGEHEYCEPEEADEETKKQAKRTATTSEETPAPKKPSSAPCFQIHMSCSGGTYVRTIAHDLSLALGSAGHVVQLHRSRQGPFDSSDAIPWEWFDGKNGEGKKWGDEALDKWEEAVVGACRKWREAQDSGGMLNVNPGAAKVGDVADGAAAAPEVPAVASEAPVVSGEQAKPTSPRAQKHLFV